jgi:hypothetical protein
LSFYLNPLADPSFPILVTPVQADSEDAGLLDLSTRITDGAEDDNAASDSEDDEIDKSEEEGEEEDSEEETGSRLKRKGKTTRAKAMKDLAKKKKVKNGGSAMPQKKSKNGKASADQVDDECRVLVMNIPLTLTAGDIGEALMAALRSESEEEEVAADLRVDFLPRRKSTPTPSSSSSSPPFDGCAYISVPSSQVTHLQRLARFDGLIRVPDARAGLSAKQAGEEQGADSYGGGDGGCVLAVIPDPWGYERGVESNPATVLDLPGCRHASSSALGVREVESVKAHCGLKCGATPREVRVLDAPLNVSTLKLGFNGRLVLGGSAGGGGAGVASARRVLLLDGTPVPALGAVHRGLLRVHRCYLTNPWRPSLAASPPSSSSSSPAFSSPSVVSAQNEVKSWGGVVLGVRDVIRLLLLANGSQPPAEKEGNEKSSITPLQVGHESKVGALLTHCLVAVNTVTPTAGPHGEDGSGAASFLDSGPPPSTAPLSASDPATAALQQQQQLMQHQLGGRKVWLVFSVQDASNTRPYKLPSLGEGAPSSSSSSSVVVLKLAHGAARATVTLRDLADLGDSSPPHLAPSSSTPHGGPVSQDDVGHWLCAAKVAHCCDPNKSASMSSAGVPKAMNSSEARSLKAQRISSALSKAPTWPPAAFSSSSSRTPGTSGSARSLTPNPSSVQSFTNRGEIGDGGAGGGGTSSNVPHVAGGRGRGKKQQQQKELQRMQAENELVAVGTVKRDRRTAQQILKDTQVGA